MKRALQAVDKTEPAPAPPNPDTGSLEDALRSTLSELDDPTDRVGGPDIAPHTPPSLGSVPGDPGRSSAPRPAATTPEKPKDTPATALDREALEEVMKRALEEVESQSQKPGPKRDKPDRRSLQDALRHALDEFDEENRQSAAGQRPLQRSASAVVAPAGPVDTTPAPRRRQLSLVAALVIAAVLVAGAAGWYLAQSHSQAPAVVATATRPASPRVTETDRAAVGQSIAVLRDLLSVSRIDVAYRVYFNRVSFAKADLDRYAVNVKDAELRAGLQEALSLHLLAAAAWRAKTLNERDKWEVVGDDPSVDLCPAAKRLLGISDEPPNMTRAQWRGVTLAAGIPLLWDCAVERVADIEKSLKDR